MLRRAFHHWRDSFRGIPRNVWLLSWVSLVNRAGGMVIAFITLYLTQKLGFGIREAGYVMTCFGIGAIAGAFTGGRLTDRFGHHRVQFWTLFASGLVLIALLWVHDFWPMCLAVGTMSFVGECFRPANTVAIIRNSNESNRTRSFSLMRMSFNIGWTIAPAVGGVIVHFWGWEWLFWIDGLTCLAAAFCLHYLLGNQAISPAMEKTLDAPLPENPAPELADLEESKPHPLSDPQYRLFLLMTLLGALAFMQILWTVPVFFREVYGWHEGRIGWVSAINGALVMLIEMPLIFQIEGKRGRLYWVRLGLILYAVSYLAFAVTSPAMGMMAAVFYMTAISFGEIFVMPFSNSWVSARATPGQQGGYMAFYTMSYSVANVLAPMLGTQIIAAWGYNSLWYFVALLSMVSLFGFWVLDGRQAPTEQLVAT